MDDDCIANVLLGSNKSTLQLRFRAFVYLMSKREGGPGTRLFSGSRCNFVFGFNTVSGRILLDDGLLVMNRGRGAKVSVELACAVELRKLQWFTVREGRLVTAVGVVTCRQ